MKSEETIDFIQYKILAKEALKKKDEKIVNLKKTDEKHFTKLINDFRRQTKQNTILFLSPIILLVCIQFFGVDIHSTLFSDNDDSNLYSNLKSGYFIENLRGDTITTWKAWNLVKNTPLIININNAEQFPLSKIDSIKQAILSEEILQLDNSLVHKGPKSMSYTYFLGWKGALEMIESDNSKFVIPVDFRVIESEKNDGNIIITLSNLKNSDGYTGYTKSIVDGNEILKSSIMIYDVGNLSDKQLEAIVRHEMGHALGLNHSSDPDDLMYSTVSTNYPMISECNVEAIHTLYDGNFNSNYVCNS